MVFLGGEVEFVIVEVDLVDIEVFWGEMFFFFVFDVNEVNYVFFFIDLVDIVELEGKFFDDVDVVFGFFFDVYRSNDSYVFFVFCEVEVFNFVFEFC